MHRDDALADLGAIGSDVLHRCGADLAWDQGEAFETSESAGAGVCYEVIPVHTRAYEEGKVYLILLVGLECGDLGVQDDTMEVGKEEHIAPLA